MLANRSIPRSTVIPELAYPEVGVAADWLCNTFGFTVRIRIGDHRVLLNVGDGAVVVIEQPKGESPADPTITHAVMVRVEDVDRHHARSAARGARVLRP